MNNYFNFNKIEKSLFGRQAFLRVARAMSYSRLKYDVLFWLFGAPCSNEIQLLLKRKGPFKRTHKLRRDLAVFINSVNVGPFSQYYARWAAINNSFGQFRPTWATAYKGWNQNHTGLLQVDTWQKICLPWPESHEYLLKWNPRSEDRFSKSDKIETFLILQRVAKCN